MQADPDILLIDEVLGVGDTEFREKSASEIKRTIKSDRSVILVSHNTEMMQKICNRVVWIEQGKTRAIGEPAEVLEAYAGNA